MPDAPDLGTALCLGDFLTEESKLEKTIYLCDGPEPFIQGCGGSIENSGSQPWLNMGIARGALRLPWPGLTQTKDVGVLGGRTGPTAQEGPGASSMQHCTAQRAGTALGLQNAFVSCSEPALLMNIHLVNVCICGRIWSHACLHQNQSKVTE